MGNEMHLTKLCDFAKMHFGEIGDNRTRGKIDFESAYFRTTTRTSKSESRRLTSERKSMQYWAEVDKLIMPEDFRNILKKTLSICDSLIQ